MPAADGHDGWFVTGLARTLVRCVGLAGRQTDASAMTTRDGWNRPSVRPRRYRSVTSSANSRSTERHPAACSRASIASGSTRVRQGSPAAATRAAAEPGASRPLVEASGPGERADELAAREQRGNPGEDRLSRVVAQVDQDPQAGHEDRLHRLQASGLQSGAQGVKPRGRLGHSARSAGRRSRLDAGASACPVGWRRGRPR